MNYTASDRRKIVFDQKSIEYSLRDDEELVTNIHFLYNALRQPKKMILSREYHTQTLSIEEYSQLREIDAALTKYRGSFLLELAVCFVQKVLRASP